MFRLDGAAAGRYDFLDMKSAAVTTRGKPGEPYDRFTRRVAADQKRVNEKIAKLDRFVPHCTACGETCDQKDAGTQCKENGMTMASRWARELAQREFYNLGWFGGSWSNEVQALACLLDRVRAGAMDRIDRTAD